MGKPWSDDEAALLSKCVCATCNNSWMGDIEGAAKPAMTPLILGQRTVLTPSDETAIAIWLGLKAIIEQNSREQDVHSREWRDEFYKERRPPVSWHIRLGRYSGTMWTGLLTGVAIDTTIQHRLVPYPLKSPGFIFTAIVGNFFGQVVGIKRQGVLPMNTEYFIEIWPHPLLRVASYSVPPNNPAQSWPPESGLDDSHLPKVIQDLSEPK